MTVLLSYMPIMFVIAAIILAVIVIYTQKRIRTRREIYAAGARGEKIATDMIKAVMRDGDHLLTNVIVQSGDMTAELDNIIINRFGVFVIEAKNYHGVLNGTENDRNWTKTKITESGNQYIKIVRNPIKQVKREVFVLKSFVKEHGISVWIDGYVILTEFNSPTESKFVLEDYDDIDEAIHRDIQMLSKSKVRRLLEMFASKTNMEKAS